MKKLLKRLFGRQRRPQPPVVAVSPDTEQVLAALEEKQRSRVQPPDVMALAMERALLGVVRDEFTDA